MRSLRRRVPRRAAAALTVMLTFGSVVGFASPAVAVPSWKVAASPSPEAVSFAALSAVSCPSATFCVAVGNSVGRSIRTLIERWDGSRWSILSSPTPGGSGGVALNGVSCTSATFCVAVGSWSGPKGRSTMPMIEQWNGSGWSITVTASPAGSGYSLLNGVACTGRDSCVAVGQSDSKTLIEHWDGSGWSIRSSPNPGAFPAAGLSGVSCPNRDSCFAVGSESRPSLYSFDTLVEHWDGARWAIVSSPSSGGLGGLSGVSCPTTSTCFAVGTAASPGAMTGVGKPLVQRWDGARWSTVDAPAPLTNSWTGLSGVSCATATSCFAVGTAGLSGGYFSYLQTFVERWDGERWSTGLAAHPTSASDSSLAGVACVTETTCVAVGQYTRGRLPDVRTKALVELGPPVPAPALALNRPIVGMAATPKGRGYWRVASDGGIFSFGNARFYGSTGAMSLNRPIVGMAATPSGHGYWLVASDGGIFSFGDARFYGSTGAMSLIGPIVGMAATPSGHGYWLVGSDGGVFAFGDAEFDGSLGTIPLAHPIVAMAATPPGASGYWLVASDGSVFGFGYARYSGASDATMQSIVGMTVPPKGINRWLVASDGTVFGF